ncbi:MAG TPA: DUF1592 domain-containing protein [Polyangia bacterium]|nr:DUF1592 domain-containing protein [Polyangia bacterium]
MSGTGYLDRPGFRLAMSIVRRGRLAGVLQQQRAQPVLPGGFFWKFGAGPGEPGKFLTASPRIIPVLPIAPWTPPAEVWVRTSFARAGMVLAACVGLAACQGVIGDGGSTPGGGPAGDPRAGAGGSGQAAKGPDGCTVLPAPAQRLWRLSAEQWGAAVKDLLSLPAAPVLTARGGEATFAFFSDVSKGVDNAMMYNMYQVAQTAVGSPSVDGQVGTTIAPCAGTTAAAQTACATSFIQSFAAKAYRRPVDSTEVSDLIDLYSQGATQGQGYKAGIELVMRAVLVAPSFVYRTELGSPATANASGSYPATTLTPYEVASQLSFTLLGTLPDPDLTAAAANGSLGTTTGIEAQIKRLLALPAVQANITNIVLGWFNISQMYSKVHDPALLASLPMSEQDQMAIENDLATSTQSFVSDILWKGSGKIDDLLTSQTVYVNQRLATLYPGLTFANGTAPASDATFVAATWPASQGRAGLLTQPSWLWAQSDPAAMSIVKRGKAIHDNIVCADPIPPPIDLTTPSAKNVIACKSPDGTQTLSDCTTEQQKSQARMKFDPCQTCHSQIDPYASVLDNFGPIGDFQTSDGAGNAVDPTATFPATAPLASKTVTGAQAFAQALITSGHFDGCSIQQLASYAIGSQITTYNTCEINPVRAATDGSIQSLLTNLLKANFVRARAGGTQ